MYGFPTVVKVKYRVLCCNFCGCTATEKINFKAYGFNVSKRLEKVVIDEQELLGSIKDTAD